LWIGFGNGPKIIGTCYGYYERYEIRVDPELDPHMSITTLARLSVSPLDVWENPK
jgi:hypothetical protein